MFWTIIIALGAAWVTQSYLSFRQSKAFADEFVALRRRGLVSIGKFQGGVVQGAVVMFGIEPDGTIREGRILRGVTVLARFGPFNVYDGQKVAEINPDLAWGAFGKSAARAVENARHNYLIISSGGTAAEPPTPLGRALNGLKWRRKSQPSQS